jgi:hypothetical protein
MWERDKERVGQQGVDAALIPQAHRGCDRRNEERATWASSSGPTQPSSPLIEKNVGDHQRLAVPSNFMDQESCSTQNA